MNYCTSIANETPSYTASQWTVLPVMSATILREKKIDWSEIVKSNIPMCKSTVPMTTAQAGIIDSYIKYI